MEVIQSHSSDLRREIFGEIMKQNTIIFLGLLALVLGISVGCGNKEKEAAQNTNVNLPLSCGNGNTTHAQLWSGYRQDGFFPYGNFAGYANGYGPARNRHHRNNYQPNSWGYVQNQSFCGCPQGYMPACDGDYGMTCVVQNQYQNFNYPVYNYNQQANQFEYYGYGQMSPVNGYSNNTCYSQVTVTCRVDDLNACASMGGHCQPSRRNSRHGICVY